MGNLTPEQVKYIFERTCLEKKNFGLEEANKLVDFHAYYHKELLYYYKCQFCGSYHMTSTPDKPTEHLMLQ